MVVLCIYYMLLYGDGVVFWMFVREGCEVVRICILVKFGMVYMWVCECACVYVCTYGFIICIDICIVIWYY